MRKLSQEEISKNNKIGVFYDELTGYSEDTTIPVYTCTMKELADRGIGTGCGSVGNKCYKTIAKKYPNIVVVCCIMDGTTNSIYAQVESDDIAAEIEELASKGGGSLRADSYDQGWRYFETE